MNVIMSIAVPAESEACRILSEAESGARSDLVRRAVESSVRLECLENTKYLYHYIIGREVGMCMETLDRYDKKNTPVDGGFQQYGNQQFPRCCQVCFEKYTLNRVEGETKKDWRRRLELISMINEWRRQVFL